MDFAAWFKSYQRVGESETRAIHRLAIESNLGWTTILRAVKGSKLQNGSATVLAAFTGNKVSVECLINAPTRQKLREDAERHDNTDPAAERAAS